MTSAEPTSGRIARVRAVLGAAARIADPADPLGREARRVLPQATGLSEQGVELALARHLETNASDEDLARLVARAGSARCVHVVLSANVFVGVVRALCLAFAASPDVRVRPSTREAAMAPLVRQALDEGTSATSFELCDAIASSTGDVIHVYGRSETIAAVERESPPGVRVVGHGPGFGVAAVSVRGPLEASAERLSWDVVAFDQHGCLSPRIALVEGSPADVERFGEALAVALESREREVPRGTLGDDERRDAALYRQTASAVGRCHAGPTFAVAVDVAPRALALPPSGRHVHVARMAEPGDLARLLAPFQGAITCVGHPPETPLAAAVLAFARGARSLPLGSMQSPPLDGPVDLRGML